MQALVNGSLFFFGNSSRSEQCEVVIPISERTAEEATSMAKGKRGIRVFECKQLLPCVVAQRPTSPTTRSSPVEYVEEKQYMHINLYDGVLEIYRDKENRIFRIEDMVELKRSSHSRVHMRFGSLNATPLFYQFHTNMIADTFQQYLEYWQDSGPVVRKAFDMIDTRRSGIISPECLTEVMYQQDVASLLTSSPDTTDSTGATRSLVTKMLSMQFPQERNAAVEVFDFEDFFQLFLDIPMHSLFGCLSEWIYRSCDHVSHHWLSLPKPFLQRESSSPPLDFSLLPGETVANVVHNIKWYLGGSQSSVASTHQALSNKSNPRGKQSITSIFPKEGLFTTPFMFGAMVITNYRVLLLARSPGDRRFNRYGVPSYFNKMDIPLSTVAQITLNSANTSSFGNHSNLCGHQSSFQLQTKDLRSILIVFMKQQRNGAETIVHMLHKMCFSGIRAHLFAYQYSRKFAVNAWPLSDIRLDYERMGLLTNSDWQIFDNSSFELSDSYPPFVVLPSCMSIKNIFDASKHRSRQRLPVVTYFDGPSGCCLLRSAQPLVGITQNTSVNDEILLNACRLSGSISATTMANDTVPSSDLFSTTSVDNSESPMKGTLSITESSNARNFYILDARGKMAATVNSVMGKGTEDVSRYPSTDLEFCNIDNIHVMRNSHSSLQDIVVPTTMGGEQDHLFYSRLCDSGWLKHTRQLLVASVNAAEKIRLLKSSVLVHCSDGWDRTAQMCLLTQLILDPHYRTLQGFCLLVEKEFCTFGFKFQDRCGHAEAMDSLPDERSPVFVQGMDAVFQIVRQYPHRFEFTPELLVFIADHVHSGLFGNFLGNNEKQRLEQLNVRRATQSIWSYVFEHKRQFIQENYETYPGPLWPQTSMKQIHLWERFFCRWNVNSHPVSPPDCCGYEPATWQDDWGDGKQKKI